MYLMVFNASPQPIPIDEAGRVVEPDDWAAVDEEFPPIQRHIGEGRLLVCDLGRVSDKRSTPAAVLVKQQVEKLNRPADAEPAKSTARKR